MTPPVPAPVTILYGTCGHCGREVRVCDDSCLRSHGTKDGRGRYVRCEGSGGWPDSQRTESVARERVTAVSPNATTNRAT